MKIATTIGEVYSCVKTPAEAVRCYYGSGFKYLDYSFYSIHKRENSPYLLDSDSLWKAEVDAAGSAAEEGGLKFVQAHLPGYNPAQPVDHELAMRTIHRSIEACGMLKIPNAVIHTSYCDEHLYPADKAAYFEYNREFLLPLLETAEKYNVTICIENSSNGNMGKRYFPRTAEDMNELADFIDHPLLKCCWDTGHALMERHFDQYDDIVTLNDNLRAVHVHDNNTTYDLHLAPYCGYLEVDRLVQGLLDINYKGYFTFEADSFLGKRNGGGASALLPVEIRRDGLALLYKIGKFILESNNAFEE